MRMMRRKKEEQVETEVEVREKKVFIVEGETFSSKAKANYYLELKRFQEQGMIENFKILDVSSKYNAIKVVIDDYVFDSKEEANYYIYLLEKKRTGDIIHIEIKPRYVLQPSFEKNGKLYRKIEYIADFNVEYRDGRLEVIDVKGFVTPEFMLKRKLFEYSYQDRELKCMVYTKKHGGWILLEERDKRVKEEKKKNKGGVKNVRN